MKIRYVLLFILIVGVGWFQYDQYQPNRNRENAEKVRLGMTSEEVLQLMGQPDKKVFSLRLGQMWITRIATKHPLPPQMRSTFLLISREK